ncbi:MAG: hypothetical protein LBG10_07850 [Treponema sp.]|nr:hypothetical protein [Treponema sp.]
MFTIFSGYRNSALPHYDTWKTPFSLQENNANPPSLNAAGGGAGRVSGGILN